MLIIEKRRITTQRTIAANALFVRQKTARFVKASLTFSLFAFTSVLTSRGAEYLYFAPSLFV